jgi:hypothetical protein
LARIDDYATKWRLEPTPHSPSSNRDSASFGWHPPCWCCHVKSR